MELPIAEAALADAPAGPAPGWVVFGLAGHRLAFPLDRIREILLPRGCTRLPGCGPEVRGLVAVRGRIVTVLDLGAVLGLRPVADGAGGEGRLLLLEHGERVVACAVDEVFAVGHAVVGWGADEMAAAPPGLDPAGTLGAGTLAGLPFLGLEPARVLDRTLG